MKKFYMSLVNHRKTMVMIFTMVFVVCLLLGNLVKVNYDINDYLPESSPSTVSLELMQEEFDGGIPNARIMISDVTIPEALEYKEKLEAVDGVTAVTWLDDVVSIFVPLSTLDTDTLETYYKDNNALFTVTIEEDRRIEAVSSIRELIGEDNAIHSTNPMAIKLKSLTK
jgi:uncharacterized protein